MHLGGRKFPQEQVCEASSLHSDCQPELAKGLTAGAFCVKEGKEALGLLLLQSQETLA